MNFSTKEIEVATNIKSTKQEALKKVLTTRERLSKRIKSIDCIIATGKMNNKKNLMGMMTCRKKIKVTKVQDSKS
jgi:hypothetical protein